VAAEGDVISVADAFAVRRVTPAATCSVGDLVVVDIVSIENDVLVGSGIQIVGHGVVGPETSRLRTRGWLLRERAAVLSEVRAFFAERGYLEVETPVAVPSPGLDVHLDAMRADDRYLITSPEYQMKRLLAGGMQRIFQIVKCFRKQEIGARHNPEFTMVEWYRAFSDVRAMIDETEALICRVLPGLEPPFERLTVADAFTRYAHVDVFTLDENDFFRIMVEAIEPQLQHPVVLMEWPIAQASLARRCEHDPRVAERFEIMVNGIELCNGFGELVDPIEQRTRFENDQEERRRRGLPVYPIDEKFVAALHEGMPPSAGNALGLDRLIALALKAKTIGDVMTFPEGHL
jgi:elongation factor P--(R)-beta-lysine ligase